MVEDRIVYVAHKSHALTWTALPFYSHLTRRYLRKKCKRAPKQPQLQLR